MSFVGRRMSFVGRRMSFVGEADVVRRRGGCRS